ncbi:MAG: GC-type dockerin domain-anchored protein [Phycisphaerales bacterium JB041]
MNTTRVRAALATLAVVGCGITHAQSYEVSWNSIDNGGGTSAGGGYTLAGTIGQHDAGPTIAGGGFTLSGGFWPGIGANCLGDFNRDGTVNTLDVLAFLNAWSAGDHSADFNRDGTVNTLDVLAFLNAWSAGC